MRALAEQRQFELAHRSLHTEQQPIIRMSRIIDSVLVDDDGPNQSTELDQSVPVAPIASQPGRLDREHGTDAAFADRCQQALEARPVDAASRSTQIIVDDLNASPTEMPGALGEPVLSALALLIVHKLIGRRLTDIDVRAAHKMLRGDLGHC
jgi:hypothetical protein